LPPLNLRDIVAGAVATARLRRCKIKHQPDYYGSSDRRERKTTATSIAKFSIFEWASSAILRDLQPVIVAAPAKLWKMSRCPPTPIVAFQTEPELGRCDKKLVLLSLKPQRFDGEHYIIIEILDAMEKGATVIAKASGPWEKIAKAAGLSREDAGPTLYPSPSPSLSLTTHSHAHTHFVEFIKLLMVICHCFRYISRMGASPPVQASTSSRKLQTGKCNGITGAA
jgi:hypothetical protein